MPFIVATYVYASSQNRRIGAVITANRPPPTSSGLLPLILSIVSAPQTKPNESVLWRGFEDVSANKDLEL